LQIYTSFAIDTDGGRHHPYMDKPPGIPVQDPEGLPFLLQILFDCAVEEPTPSSNCDTDKPKFAGL
jgi:hypothetical protein